MWDILVVTKIVRQTGKGGNYSLRQAEHDWASDKHVSGYRVLCAEEGKNSCLQAEDAKDSKKEEIMFSWIFCAWNQYKASYKHIYQFELEIWCKCRRQKWLQLCNYDWSEWIIIESMTVLDCIGGPVKFWLG